MRAYLLPALFIALLPPPALALSGMAPDPTKWVIATEHDFADGDNQSLYTKFCGVLGGATNINFSAQNVTWQDGALVLKFEKRTNRSCTGKLGAFATGGIAVKTAGYKSLAVEMMLSGTDVRGLRPYATTWPKGGQGGCGWGAEDDFIEQSGTTPSKVWATTHTWSSACSHRTAQTWYTIPTWADYHNYGVIRETTVDAPPTSLRGKGCVDFYLDGVKTGGSCDLFRPYVMGASAGIAGSASAVDQTRLPATVRIKKIRVWKKL